MSLNLYEIGPDDTAVELPYSSDRIFSMVGTRGDWITLVVLCGLLLLIAAGFGYTLGAYWT